MVGKSCFDFLHTEDQSHMKESFDQVIKMKGQVIIMTKMAMAINNGNEDYIALGEQTSMTKNLNG